MKNFRHYIQTHGLLLSLTGILLFWLALPPVNCWILAFLAPVPWILLIHERRHSKNLYRSLYFAGFLFWLYEVHFVRYPHPINYFLLILLAAYMGIYLPLFVAVSRNLIHARLPRIFLALFGQKKYALYYHRTYMTLFVTPIIYIACDLLRGWIITGYLMGSLCHTLYRVPLLIQTADIMGEFGVSGLTLLISASLTLMIYHKNLKMLFPLGFTLLFIFLYGYYRLHETSPRFLHAVSEKNTNFDKNTVSEYPASFEENTLSEKDILPSARIALIQGNIPAVLVLNEEVTRNTETQYYGLMQKIVEQEKQANRPLNLIVLPESIYRRPVIFAEENAICPEGMMDQNGLPFTEEKFHARLHELSVFTQKQLQSLSEKYETAVITGGNAEVFTSEGYRGYNAAFYVQPKASGLSIPITFYAKMHLVPFGEYVPFLESFCKIFPDAEKISPIGAGSPAGEKPESFPISTHQKACQNDINTKISPDTKKGVTLNATMSICFETVVGRLIRRQIYTLEKEGKTTDFLLNLTNNGWFRNSHETKLHLACGVFRAVENRRKLLVAANYGISAEISENGEILQESPHGLPDILVAEVGKWSGRRTPYTYYGHILWIIPISFIIFGMIPCKRFPPFKTY
ncbi:MAG: apolipoprotein N-acyltransferase [Planctomycetia bacterium]|nr:apolipoprotein N-acyltransferase [Planctomycetia bacterium]